MPPRKDFKKSFERDLAHAVGVRTAAVSWGVHPLAILRSRNPTFVTTSFGDLQEWLLKQKI